MTSRSGRQAGRQETTDVQIRQALASSVPCGFHGVSARFPCGFCAVSAKFPRCFCEVSARFLRCFCAVSARFLSPLFLCCFCEVSPLFLRCCCQAFLFRYWISQQQNENMTHMYVMSNDATYATPVFPLRPICCVALASDDATFAPHPSFASSLFLESPHPPRAQ